MKHFLLASAMVLAFAAGIIHAQIPRTLSYQGVLTDQNSNLRADTKYRFIFRLYDAAAGGSALWSQAESLSVTKGLFSTVLGTTPFPSSMKFDTQYWLGIQVDSEPELAPRVALTSAAYSMNAVRADTARVAIAAQGDGIWSVIGANIYRVVGGVGIGPAANSDAKLFVNTGGGAGQSLKLEHMGSNFIVRPVSAGSSSTIVENTGGGSLCLNPALGSIGIGTTNPLSNLHVGKIGNNTPTVGNGWGDFSISDGDYGLAFGVKRVSAPFVGTNAVASIWVKGGNFGGLTIGTSKYPNILHISNSGSNGRVSVPVLQITGGSDLAEPFEMSHVEVLEPGSVVIIDEENPGKLKLSSGPYDRRVAGVVSGAGGINPGLTLKQEGVMEGSQNVALTGRVYVKATAANGPVKPGDLLTTSDIPGYAMRASDDLIKPGVTIGKAMSALNEGTGLVLVLVNLQ